MGLVRLRGEITDPAQLEFLRAMEVVGLEDRSVREVLKSLGVSAERMVKWLDDERFVACWLGQGVYMELLEVPSMLRLMRDRARGVGLGDNESGAKWADLWLKAVKDLAVVSRGLVENASHGKDPIWGGGLVEGAGALEASDVADLGMVGEASTGPVGGA